MSDVSESQVEQEQITAEQSKNKDEVVFYSILQVNFKNLPKQMQFILFEIKVVQYI